MQNIIHVHVYDPRNALFGKGNDRAEIHTYTCEKSPECDAFKKGCCILVGNPFGPRCFGRKSIKEGPTQRSKKFSEFLNEGKSHPKYRALKTQPKKMFRVESGYMMPYPHINLDENSPFESKSGFMTSGFPYLDNVSKESLSKIFTQRPQAIFGGEITDYQKKVVPEIVKHMHDCYPNLFKMLVEAHPEAEKIVDNFDYSGKKAILKTLLPGKMVISRHMWEWDGEKLIGPAFNMVLTPVDSSVVHVYPEDDATVEVTNTDMVGSETEIVD